MKNIKYLIYTKENCGKCKFTENMLKLPISSQSCDIIKDDKALREAKSMGFKALPIVKILDNNDNVLDLWNDLNLSKIKYWNEKYIC